MAARSNTDSCAVVKEFNCSITLWTQDQIYFIYYEDLIAICIIDTMIQTPRIVPVILQGSNNPASVKARNEEGATDFKNSILEYAFSAF